MNLIVRDTTEDNVKKTSELEYDTSNENPDVIIRKHFCGD